jgi:hypothetical protein
MSMKLMKENSMSAVNTDTKQMMINTSRAVAYPTSGQNEEVDNFFFQQRKI